jgi:hypothetical protein
MVKGRDAVIVLGLATAATVVVLVLANLLRLGDDFAAPHPSAAGQRAGGTSWVLPQRLTPVPVGSAREALRRRATAAAAVRPGLEVLAGPARSLAATSASPLRATLVGGIGPASRVRVRRPSPPSGADHPPERSSPPAAPPRAPKPVVTDSPGAPTVTASQAEPAVDLVPAPPVLALPAPALVDLDGDTDDGTKEHGRRHGKGKGKGPDGD